MSKETLQEALTKAKTYTVAVFRTVSRGKVIWSGYTYNYNETWKSFVEKVNVVATTHKRAVAAAIKLVREEYCDECRGKGRFFIIASGKRTKVPCVCVTEDAK